MSFFNRNLLLDRPTARFGAWFVVVTVLLSALLLANMGFIFWMSSEGPEESGNRSGGITDTVIDVTYPDFDRRPPEEQVVITDRTHHLVRKLAHFCEFALLGLLSAALLAHLARRLPLSTKMLWGFPAAFCLLYAISDEVHQMFTERGPAVKDVLIDFSGSLTGLLLLHLGVYLVRRILVRCRARMGKETAA